MKREEASAHWRHFENKRERDARHNVDRSRQIISRAPNASPGGGGL